MPPIARSEMPLANRPQPFVCYGHRQVDKHSNTWEPVWFVQMPGKQHETFEHWSIAIVFAIYACKYPHVMKANCQL